LEIWRACVQSTQSHRSGARFAVGVNHIKVTAFDAFALRKFFDVFDVARRRFTSASEPKQRRREIRETIAAFLCEREIARSLSKRAAIHCNAAFEKRAANAVKRRRNFRIVRVTVNQCLIVKARFVKGAVEYVNSGVVDVRREIKRELSVAAACETIQISDLRARCRKQFAAGASEALDEFCAATFVDSGARAAT
jgi:hypothetical protein